MKSDDVKNLIDGYLAAWNESDAMTRLQILQRVWADDGHFTGWGSDVKGRDALSHIIARLHKSVPGTVFSLNGALTISTNFVLFAYIIKAPNGIELNGTDFGEIADDGRLRRIVTFF